MSSSTVLTTAVIATLLFVSSTMGHSQMRCAKYNPQTGECNAPVRRQVETFLEEAFDLSSGNGLCQKPMANPITAAYSNGKACGDAGCPAPMGTFTPGENFYVQWVARNHAVADQTPGNVTIYLSPVESVNQGIDVSADVFRNNKFCTASFMSCGGKNGDLVPCYAPCTMPSNLQSGTYTLWWKWVWPGHTSVYSTCADINVVASGSTPVPSQPTPAQQSTTGTKVTVPSTTGAKTPAVPSTTGVKSPAVPSTTGAKAPSTPSTTGVKTAQPSTTGQAAIPTPSTPSGKCITGNMKCLSSETYSTCDAGSWGQSQSCSTGTTCSLSGDHIYCVKTSTPVTPTPTPTPVPSTPSTTTTSSPSDSCVMGYQKCTGTNSYSTCGNGKNGPTWSTDLFCQAGLSCHESSTANNIYCY